MLPRDACPTPHEMRQVLLGRLPEAHLEVLEAHLEGCALCQQVLDRLEVDGPLGCILKEQSPDGAGPDGELGDEVGELVEQLERLGTPSSLGSSGSGSSAAGPADGDGFPFLAPAQATDELGRLVQYRVLELLGTGGMGLVFRAQDTHLERLVALKVLRPRYSRKPEARERFLREARAMAAVKHDNITTIFQVGEVAAEPVPFLAMELLEGESLADWLRRHGRPPAALVARLGRQMAAGLAAAHAHGLIHRDVKPANLWLEAPPGWADEPPAARPALAAVGRVKLLDFGLAMPLDDGGREDIGPGAPEREIMGTPAYMAPEQIRGEPLDGRCDLFALGCVLYELCAGAPPFYRDRRQLRSRTLADPPPRSLTETDPAVPAALAELIGQLLAPRPSDRPVSARWVEQQLATIEGAAGAADTLSGSHHPTEQLTPVAPQRVRRRRWLPAAATGAVLVVATALLLFWWPWGDRPATAPVPVNSDPPLVAGSSPQAVVEPDVPVRAPEPPPAADKVLADWVTQDIGPVGQRGFSHYNHETGVFTAAGSGADVWGTTDSFRYTYQRLTGDGAIVARVTQIQGTHFWAKVGVMMRETLAADSKHVSMLASAGMGPQFLWRDATGGNSGDRPRYHRRQPFAPVWVRLERRGETFRGSFSSDGATWTDLGSRTVAMTATVYVGFMSCALNNSRTNVGILDDVSVLPVGWSAQGVGSVRHRGFSQFDQATAAFTVAGSGADIWWAADGFRYTYQRLTGDGAIVARVVQNQNTDSWAKVGVMMRETLAAGSKHVSMLTTAGQGPQFLWRDATGGGSVERTPYRGKRFAPRWVRLERRGDTFRGSFSPDGDTWSEIGSATVAMTDTVYVGLASSAHNNTRINVGILDHVAVLDAAALRRLPALKP